MKFQHLTIPTGRSSKYPRNLREHVARRMGSVGVNVGPDDLVITAGCMEAVSLALQETVVPNLSKGFVAI